ncbi:hypothetical protein GCM10007932_25900 [Vibrio penaeicida]|uniref:Uncharacterized protein n=1 Tax=Vibrio penaeicida TaxID=104609 RepID=A0AAV5NRB3_9VIBR|nr:hypothetical protein GCM10007932_25900 [Vibrio penaeicida]
MIAEFSLHYLSKNEYLIRPDRGAISFIIYPSNLNMLGSASIAWFLGKALICRFSGSKSKIDNAA